MPASGGNAARRARKLTCAAAAATIAGCAASSGSGPGLPAGPVALRIELLDGASISAGSLRGKIVLIHVFNTWAAPALIEVPRLSELARAHPDELAIVGVALDDEPEAIPIFAEKFEVPYPIGTVHDRSAFTGPRGPFGPITLIPTSIVLDRAGRIALRSDGTWPPEILEEAIDRLLAADPARQ